MAQTNHGIHSAPLPDMANIEVDNNGVLLVQNGEVNNIFLVTNIFRFVCSSTNILHSCILHIAPLQFAYCILHTAQSMPKGECEIGTL